MITMDKIYTTVGRSRPSITRPQLINHLPHKTSRYDRGPAVFDENCGTPLQLWAPVHDCQRVCNGLEGLFWRNGGFWAEVSAEQQVQLWDQPSLGMNVQQIGNQITPLKGLDSFSVAIWCRLDVIWNLRFCMVDTSAHMCDKIRYYNLCIAYVSSNLITSFLCTISMLLISYVFCKNMQPIGFVLLIGFMLHIFHIVPIYALYMLPLCYPYCN